MSPRIRVSVVRRRRSPVGAGLRSLLFALVAGAVVGPASQAVQAAVPASLAATTLTSALQPSSDLLATNVVPVRNGTVKSGALWPFVADGTTWASADDAVTLVRTKLQARSGVHETGYSGAPTGVVTAAVVHVRANQTARAAGGFQVMLYDGATKIGTGPVHSVTAGWANYSDTFTGLSVASANTLRTSIAFTNSTGRGAIQYTELWTTITYQPPAPADAPPAVTISSPADNAVVRGSVTVSGTATDDFGLADVSYSVDGGAPNSLGATSPWSFVWDSTAVTSGTHLIAVTATDSAGQTTTHNVSVRIDAPPSVAISSPLDGATVSGPVSVSGTAGDDVGLSSLAITVDGGVPTSLATGSTWSFPWDSTGAPGQHVLAVSATDTAGQTSTAQITVTAQDPASSAPPPASGYFSQQPVQSWSSLPGDSTCASLVHRSTWEPRPDNYKRNHTLVDPAAVHAAFAARPLAVDNNYDSRWDSWLLPRVDGQFQGTTDEIFQWAACKWGLPDNLLRAIAVRESTWYQYETYPSGRCVTDWGCGDFLSSATAATRTYCDGLATAGGYDYQRDYGVGLCPRTFSIVGVMDWEDPAWGVMPDNQNGTFPFNRDSTAFAVDYLGADLRGCFEGWEHWLGGTYAAGDIWGCVGSWYAGDWHSAAGDGYASRVQNEWTNLTWLQRDWPSIHPSCSAIYGCPGPDPL
jgi:Bacterial Ig domain